MFKKWSPCVKSSVVRVPVTLFSQLLLQLMSAINHVDQTKVATGVSGTLSPNQACVLGYLWFLRSQTNYDFHGFSIKNYSCKPMQPDYLMHHCMCTTKIHLPPAPKNPNRILFQGKNFFLSSNLQPSHILLLLTVVFHRGGFGRVWAHSIAKAEEIFLLSC